MVQWVRESMLEYMLPEKALESTAAVDFIARVSKVSPSSVHTRLLLSSTRHTARVVISARGYIVALFAVFVALFFVSFSSLVIRSTLYT